MCTEKTARQAKSDASTSQGAAARAQPPGAAEAWARPPHRTACTWVSTSASSTETTNRSAASLGRPTQQGSD